ncbi:hypothetical protein BDP81DRAFT_422143, partial [Colletotrichum phormii]
MPGTVKACSSSMVIVRLWFACMLAQSTTPPERFSSADRCTFPARLFDVHSDQVTAVAWSIGPLFHAVGTPSHQKVCHIFPLRFDLQKIIIRRNSCEIERPRGRRTPFAVTMPFVVISRRGQEMDSLDRPAQSSALTPYFGRGMSLFDQSVSSASCRFYVEDREFLRTPGTPLPDSIQRVDIQRPRVECPMLVPTRAGACPYGQRRRNPFVMADLQSRTMASASDRSNLIFIGKRPGVIPGFAALSISRQLPFKM